MKNIPEKIYLQIGEDCDAESFNSLNREYVTWSSHRIENNDIEYSLQPSPPTRLREVIEGQDELWKELKGDVHESSLHAYISDLALNKLKSKYHLSKLKSLTDQPLPDAGELMDVTKDAIGKLAEKHNKADAEFIKNNTMRKFTDEEIKAAKETRDALINEDMPTEMKALYMAGEIVVWDEMQQPPLPDGEYKKNEAYNDLERAVNSNHDIAEYWKKRCEAAEAVIHIFPIKGHYFNTNDDKKEKVYETWQQLKQTPATDEVEKQFKEKGNKLSEIIGAIPDLPFESTDDKQDDRFKTWLEERIENYQQEKQLHGKKERIQARLSMLKETLENYERWK